MATYSISNSPENINLNNFYSYLLNTPLSKSARFIVRILPKANSLIASTSQDNSIPTTRSKSVLNTIMYQCESTELPGRGFMNADYRYYGPSFKLPFQTSYEDITFNLLCRNDFLERQFFDDWMDLINPTTNFDFRFREEYASDVEIFQFSEAINQSTQSNQVGGKPQVEYQFTLVDAWPILVNAQPLTWADDNFHRLSVTFTYSKWLRQLNQQKTYSIVTGSNIDNTSTSFPTPK